MTLLLRRVSAGMYRGIKVTASFNVVTDISRDILRGIGAMWELDKGRYT